MREKGVLPGTPTQNVQMMKAEPREEDTNVNMMLRSGAATGEYKGKKPEEDAWVHKTPRKQPEFDLERTKETFMEAKKGFTETSTSGSKDQADPKMYTSMLTTLLETCMKLLQDTKVVKGLKEMITRCTRPDEPCMVRRLGKHVLCTGWEMWLTVQIGDFEMD